MRQVLSFIIVLVLCACSTHNKNEILQQALDEFVKDKDATIGVAIIIDGKDTVSVNGNRQFPMLSVYKFPIALTLCEHYRQHHKSLDHPITIQPEYLQSDTYSPMTEKILASSRLSTDTLRMPTRELLRFMLQLSDNNASDIVLNTIGGAEFVDKYLAKLGISDLNVRNSEDEMHRDNQLCYANSATPIAMASLMDKFDREFSDSLSIEIKQMIETCQTGTERLPKPLIPAKAVIGHKTGTGFTLPDGRLMSVNDAGYIDLPDGHRYTIAVFIENSGYDMTQTESIIAEISEIAMRHICKE